MLRNLQKTLKLNYFSRSSLLQVLLKKAVQKTNKMLEKKFLVEDKIWKTNGRYSDDLRNKWNEFKKIMMWPPETSI